MISIEIMTTAAYVVSVSVPCRSLHFICFAWYPLSHTPRMFLVTLHVILAFSFSVCHCFFSSIPGVSTRYAVASLGIVLSQFPSMVFGIPPLVLIFSFSRFWLAPLLLNSSWPPFIFFWHSPSQSVLASFRHPWSLDPICRCMFRYCSSRLPSMIFGIPLLFLMILFLHFGWRPFSISSLNPIHSRCPPSSQCAFKSFSFLTQMVLVSPGFDFSLHAQTATFRPSPRI